MAEGPDRGLELIDEIEGLDDYHLLHAARGNLLQRLGRNGEAADAYRRALGLVSQPAQREFMERRLAELERG
jgi:predicted RNA polymerase sigma factor